MKIKFLNTLIVIVPFFFLGCGGGGNSSGSTDNTTNNTNISTATFIDSAVSGIEFETDTQSGVTDANGNFIYRDGEKVTFHIGNLYLGSATPANGKVTPLDIIGTENTSEPRVVRMLQTLQSMDSDGDTSNGISISSVLKETLKTQSKVELNTTVVTDANVTALIGQFKVDASTAINHFEVHKNDPSNNKTAYTSTTPTTIQSTGNGKYTLLAWNDLGMHCVDGKDYSVFSILPPYNNLHAHLISKDSTTNKLITNGVTITYEATADTMGSINTGSASKTNFWDWVSKIFGDFIRDIGLAGNPTQSLTPAPMSYNTTHGWWEAEGIPAMPYDDNGIKNYYPMVKVVARDSSGTVLATTKVVLPVSDEMSCVSCHASTSSSNGAKPTAGWVNDSDSEKDWKKNILKLHDQKYPNAISTASMSSTYTQGSLLATANAGQPILCASCHKSNALGTLQKSGIKSLTEALHSKHATVIDPSTQASMNSSTNRDSCYKCHPGSSTKCLRGAMGNAKTTAGTNAIDCQSCHGSMSTVGASSREGWLDEPSCQQCHDKDSSGKFQRYTSVFSSGTTLRATLDTKFATNADTPASGKSLYRFSKGHGNLQCESCHGATHAEYPTSHANDNVQSIALQGHSGTIAECSTCHTTTPTNFTGGPHGMHPTGQSVVSSHEKEAKNNLASCAVCHGSDYRGTFLSKTTATRTLTVEHKTKTLSAWHNVSCYDCHNGPRGD